jgi:hypothetical protein
MEKLRILSSTLAELYIRQGLFDRALDVYEQLLANDANNIFYRSRLALLRKETPNKDRLRLLARLLKRIEEKQDARVQA